MDCCAWAAEAALPGARARPHFDAPYAATSLAMFWGRRWNLFAGRLLKSLVYDVVMQARSTAPGLHVLMAFCLRSTLCSWSASPLVDLRPPATFFSPSARCYPRRPE